MIPTGGIYTESICISNGSFFKLKPLVFSWLRYEACKKIVQTMKLNSNCW